MPKKISVNNESSEATITFVDLGKIISRYNTDRIKKFPKDLIDDSRAVWISKGKILEFFEKNSTATGVRFYFGVVDDANSPKGVHNLVLIPTSGNMQDQVSDNDSVLITQNSTPPPPATRVASAIATGTPAESNSSICPPPKSRCQGSSFIN